MRIIKGLGNFLWYGYTCYMVFGVKGGFILHFLTLMGFGSAPVGLLVCIAISIILFVIPSTLDGWINLWDKIKEFFKECWARIVRGFHSVVNWVRPRRS